jgi:hypothetical protein
MMRLSVGVVACAVVVATMPAAVLAQAWIGAMVGNMAAADQRAAEEKACRDGVPAKPKIVTWATSSSAASLAGYFALTAKSSAGALGKVFAMKKTDLSWKGPDGAVAVAQLGARLDEPTPALKPLALVVGGDGSSARGVWEASWDGQPGKTAYYAIDFAGGYPDIWGGGVFRIWHLTIFPGDQQPAVPAAYCHWDKDQAW